MFSRYRIYHFEDFTCILPLSIDSGRPHKKSSAHSSLFRGFFAKCVWQIFKTGCTITYPHPHPVHYTNMFCRFMLFRSSFTNTEGGKDRGGIKYYAPPIGLKSANYMKKLLKTVLDYRCVQPVLRRNHTCVIPVSNF